MIKLIQLPPCPSCGLCGLAWADHFSQLLSQSCLPSLSIFLLFASDATIHIKKGQGHFIWGLGNTFLTFCSCKVHLQWPEQWFPQTKFSKVIELHDITLHEFSLDVLPIWWYHHWLVQIWLACGWNKTLVEPNIARTQSRLFLYLDITCYAKISNFNARAR